MKLNELAKLLHGDWNGDWLNISGPGHKKKDRSASCSIPKRPMDFGCTAWRAMTQWNVGNM